ncbi:MAG TPA: R3H domain-containing nucleic acid-binding protein [Anaerolineaceae bacterium]|nr:R3H domain-containing nucleic acid-binding protein [Anaerolineaceae bacterium]
MTQKRITDDLQALMEVLPPAVAKAVVQVNNSDNLLEIILDLGRKPMARFVADEIELSQNEVQHADIDYVVSRIGDFDADNRAGLERTLHRISAIRNRRSHIVGLTCRVGRAVYGTIDIIQDLVESGKSILILGRPGIGKTTMLREAARILAEKKRVIIVDTSNEIGGDGDVPHPAVGRARRMQVAAPSLQHEVMIEAVENHNPEVIVIDEIGRELEAAAARTIAERGVQLIGTAHGRTLENLLLNPTLSDLIGGIESVTLSDEEARRRGTQKTVLERRAPPTFDVLIEIQERNYLVIHPDVAEAVDTLVRGQRLQPEIRFRDEKDEIHIQKPAVPSTTRSTPKGMRRSQGSNGDQPYAQLQAGGNGGSPYLHFHPGELVVQSGEDEQSNRAYSRNFASAQPVHIYPYGVARNRLTQAAKRLGVPAIVVRDIGEAEAVMTLRAYYRSREQTIIDAETRGMPIYVLRANTVNQMEQSLAEIFNISMDSSINNWEDVSGQTQAAIEAVLSGQRWMDLPAASAPIRRIQHEMAREAQLVSHSYGKEPNRRVRIFRE